MLNQQANLKLFHNMDTTQTMNKEQYEAPVLHDIQPVTTVRGEPQGSLPDADINTNNDDDP